MHMQTSLPHDQHLEMENLEQLWGGLSIENTNNENVSYVRIPVHSRGSDCMKSDHPIT